MGDFNEKGVVNHEMAVYKWDATYFMTENEIKELKGDRAPMERIAP